MNDSDGYWTGIPLPNLKHYALMKTWPAPEMPRPGCVWTHVLLIPFSEFANIVELSSLKRYFKRPDFPIVKEFYSSPVYIDKEEIPPNDSEPLQESVCLQVLRSFYGGRTTDLLEAPSGLLDGVIFAVWSQQWPRLRRSFSFRTAGGPNEDHQSQQFEVKIITHAGSLYRDYARYWETSKDTAMWEGYVVNDLIMGRTTPLRRFLWRYGSDVRRGRERFTFLVKMFLRNHDLYRKNPKGEFEQILLEVAEVLPDPADGLTLKRDLVSFGNEPLTQLMRSDSWELLETFVRHRSMVSLPQPDDTILRETLEATEPAYTRALDLARIAVVSQTAFASRYLVELARVVDPRILFREAGDDRQLLVAMIKAAPELLDFDELAQIPKDELLALLEFLPNDLSLLERTVDRLLELDSRPIANYLIRRHPQTVLHQLATYLDQHSGRYVQHVAGTWLYVAAECATNLLEEGLLQKIRSTKDLAMIASILGYRNAEGVNASPIAWANVLSSSVDDVTGQQRQMLLAFFLSIALQNPLPGCEALFEISFESIHNDIWGVRLPHQASVLLNGLLPDVGWWQQWDTCLRLRMAVSNAYVRSGLSVESFRKLSNDRHLYGRLVEEIDESFEGRMFLSKVL